MLIGSWFDSGSHLSLGWRGAEVQVLGFVGVEVVLLGLHHPAHPISSASPALPPSLVLRLLIPRRAEAAVFCLLLLSDVDTVTTLEEVEVAEVAEKRCLL